MDRVRAESVRTLYLQMPNSAAAAIVVTLYMIGTAWAFTPWRVIMAWAAVQAATQIWRQVLIRAWRRRVRADAELKRWANFYTGYMVVTGLLWGSTIFLFAHPTQPATVALTLCCLYGVSGGSVPGNAYNPPGLYALVGFMFAPVVVRLLATGVFAYELLGLASGLFAVTMAAFCRTQTRAIEESFEIRFENRALLEELTVQKADADDARRRAELANLAKSQFLAAASHDLRQPLYALSLFSASLQELKLDAEGRAVVTDIQDSIEVMDTLFNGLLDLSKLEAGAVQPRMRAVSVDEVFDRLSQVFRPLASARGVELRFRSDGERVVSDAALLEQVLANLISNSIRCTERGGVLVAARRRRGGVRLEVWDTGKGIAPADAERIFEEFVQLANPERDRRKGLGLGLSIARRSAALIGARIELVSRLGTGSRFAFSQAVATNGAAETVAAAAIVRPAPRRKGLPLLVVEDDRDVRRALADLLRRWGLKFDAVENADAALGRIRGGVRYGIILSDYRLTGGMDGLALVGAVRDLQGEPTLCAALITADFDPALIGRARDLDVPILFKPLRPAELRTLLDL